MNGYKESFLLWQSPPKAIWSTDASTGANPSVAQTPMEQAFARFKEARDARDLISEGSSADAWERACEEAQLARAGVCRETIKNESDFWLLVQAALSTCGGVAGVLEEMDVGISAGTTCGSTMALAVLLNLVQLRSNLVM